MVRLQEGDDHTPISRDLELPDILGLGIYASLSKLNHSCTPNLEVEYADSNVARVRVGVYRGCTHGMQVRLLKPVLEDEQATIAYIDEAMTLSNRRKALLEVNISRWDIIRQAELQLHLLLPKMHRGRTINHGR